MNVQVTTCLLRVLLDGYWTLLFTSIFFFFEQLQPPHPTEKGKGQFPKMLNHPFTERSFADSPNSTSYKHQVGPWWCQISWLLPGTQERPQDPQTSGNLQAKWRGDTSAANINYPFIIWAPRFMCVCVEGRGGGMSKLADKSAALRWASLTRGPPHFPLPTQQTVLRSSVWGFLLTRHIFVHPHRRRLLLLLLTSPQLVTTGAFTCHSHTTYTRAPGGLVLPG